MAIISQQQQDEANGQQQPPSGPTQISGTSAGSGTGQGAGTGTGQNTASAPTSGVAQNQAPQASQGYTDVASYLNANQGGSQQLGNQVASNLTNQYNTTKQGIDTSSQNAQNQVKAGYTPENTDLINQVAANPTQSAANSDTLSQYQAQLNDTYGGPTSWADLGTQQGNVDMANQEAGLTKTPGGLNVLTSQAENALNPGQTSQGINQLDTMLLGGSPNAMQTVQSAADPYSTLNDYINQQNTSVNNAIQTGQTQANQASQDALNAFTGVNGTYTNLNNTVNQQYSDALAAAQAQQAGLKADISNLYGGQALQTGEQQIGAFGNNQTTPWYNTTGYNVGQLSPQDLAAMGMTQDQWNALQGGMQQAGTSTMELGHNFGAGTPTTQMDLNQYLNMQDPTQMISAANTATPEQYAQMSAIQQLLGSKAPQGAAINPLNASQAGTYNPADLNQFNYNAALGDVGNYNTQAVQAAKDEAQMLSNNADQAHAAGQHSGGFLGGVKNAITHPLQTAEVISNPLSWGANTVGLLKGQSPDALNMNQPGAKVAGTVAGGVLGSIVPGIGTAGGAMVGGALGTGAEYAGEAGTQALGDKNTTGDTTKSGLAHGGEVQDIDKYLDAKKVK